MSAKQSAFEKVNTKRVPIHISTEVAKFIDSLYDDDDEDASAIPDALIFKNPYTKEQIEFALRRLVGFYVTKSIIDSFTLDEVVSTPDLLEVGITIKIKEYEFDISISTNF